MNWELLGATLWTFLNSPTGITLLGGAILWLLNRIYAAKPMWKQFEGTICDAIRTAEKLIPDDTPNKGLAKLDAALELVLAAFESAKGRAAKPAEEAALKNAIQLKHNELDLAGALSPSPPVPAPSPAALVATGTLGPIPAYPPRTGDQPL